MSRVARQGFATRGRGSVNFRLRSPELAENYVFGGWKALANHPGTFLHYCTIPDLKDARKDPKLIDTCRRYDPQAKMILSVSVVTDVDSCPETPLNGRSGAGAGMVLPETRPQYGREPEPFKQRANSLPYSRSAQGPRSIRRRESSGSTSAIVKQILRSMENIAPGEMRRESSASTSSIVKNILRSMENIAPGPPPEEPKSSPPRSVGAAYQSGASGSQLQSRSGSQSQSQSGSQSQRLIYSSTPSMFLNRSDRPSTAFQSVHQPPIQQNPMYGRPPVGSGLQMLDDESAV